MKRRAVLVAALSTSGCLRLSDEPTETAAPTEDQAVYAVDRADGTRWWRASIDGWALGSPAVTADTVYVSTRNGTVHALAARDGRERFALDVVDGTIGPPTIASGRLLVARGATYAYE